MPDTPRTPDTDHARRRIAEALLLDMDGDYLPGAGLGADNAGQDVPLDQARPHEVAHWAARVIAGPARPDATPDTDNARRLASARTRSYEHLRWWAEEASHTIRALADAVDATRPVATPDSGDAERVTEALTRVLADLDAEGVLTIERPEDTPAARLLGATMAALSASRAGQTTVDTDTLRARMQADTLRARLEAVRRLHQPEEHYHLATINEDGSTTDHAVEALDGSVVSTAEPEVRCSCTPQGLLPYPCPTRRALDGDTPAVSPAGTS